MITPAENKTLRTLVCSDNPSPTAQKMIRQGALWLPFTLCFNENGPYTDETKRFLYLLSKSDVLVLEPGDSDVDEHKALYDREASSYSSLLSVVTLASNEEQRELDTYLTDCPCPFDQVSLP